MASAYADVYRVVSRIPRGRVATYGQVGLIAGLPGAARARMVGYALAALADGSRLPWHRVINASGRISARRDGGGVERLQWARLRSEGVRFDALGRIRLADYRWRPRVARSGAKRRDPGAGRTS